MKRALMGVLLLSSCAGEEIVMDFELRDYRGVIHCHSHFSHDSEGTYGEILAAAKAAGLDFVIMTDHPPKGERALPLRAGWRGMRDGVLFIQGAEYAGDNLLGLGLVKPAQGAGPRDKIRAIHAQGGVAIVSHPEEVTDWGPYAEADGMEIYNVHAAFKRRAKEKGFLVRALKEAKERPDQAFGLLHQVDPVILAKWDELNRTRRWAGIAGNDAHQNVNVLGVQLDPYERAFRFVRTHVLAQALTENAILDAIKRGRCYVQFGHLSDARFGPDGVEWIGEKRSGLADVTVPGGARFEGSHVRWIRNGRSGMPVDRTRVRGSNRTSYTLKGPGVFRAELFHPASDEAPWILTNPVTVTP